MLVVTGLMVAWVLVVMVGQHRPDHAGGRLAARHADRGAALPYWSGLWFGLFPTWQGIGLQAAALAFVLGSYVAVEWQRSRRRGRVTADPRVPRPARSRTSRASSRRRAIVRHLRGRGATGHTEAGCSWPRIGEALKPQTTQ